MPQPKKDAAHRYFTYDKVSNTSLCQLCNKKLKGKHTTNLKNHLSAKHKTEFQVMTGKTKTASTVNNNLKDNDTSPVIEIIKKLCVRLVTVHGRPLAMMEDDAFREIINIATKSTDGHTHTNIKAIKNGIQQEAYDLKRKISIETKNKLVSLKLDSVTCLERQFIGINIQYIKNARIVIRNLSVLEVTHDQIATFLKNTLVDILAEFMISPNQIYSICIDNGNNMIKMMKLIGSKYDSQDVDNEDPNDDDSEVEENKEETIDDILELNTDDILPIESPFRVRRMVCATHTLQLAFKDAKIANTTAQSTILMAKQITYILRKSLILNSTSQTNFKKPVKGCTTRWTATYNMLVRLVELKEFCCTIPEISSLVSDRFWSDILALTACYKSAIEATIALQKEELTIGDFFIIWLNCKNKVAAIQHEFAIALRDAMEQRERNILQNDVMLEGLYLDGRLNVILSETECQKARLLLNEVYQQMKDLNGQDLVGDEIQTTVSIEIPTTSREQSLFDTSSDLAAVENILLDTERKRGNLRHSRSFESCLHDIVTSPRLSLTENIIAHWNDKTITSSDIAEVANIVLAAPVTQVSVERLFSTLKFILHPLRRNMNKKILNDLMFLRSNKDML